MANDHDLDALEDEGDNLQQRSDRLAHDIERTKSDWQSKQADQSVPGAVEAPDDGDEEPRGDKEEGSA